MGIIASLRRLSDNGATFTVTVGKDCDDDFYNGYWFSTENKIEDRQIINDALSENKVYIQFRSKAPANKITNLKVEIYRVEAFSDSLVDTIIFGNNAHPDLKIEKIERQNEDPLFVVTVKKLVQKYYAKSTNAVPNKLYFKIYAKIDNNDKGPFTFPKNETDYLKVNVTLRCAVIRVQVLDSKDGRPLAAQRVKMIEIGSDLKFFFSNNSSKVTSTGCVGAQTALNGFFKNESCNQKLYDCEQPSAKFNTPKKKKAYKDYLHIRGYLNNPLPAEPEGDEPPAFVQEFIKNEFNGMQMTNSDGFLNIHVPVDKYLHEKECTIGIKLWDAAAPFYVPLGLERTKKDDSLVKRSKFYVKKDAADPKWEDRDFKLHVLWNTGDANKNEDITKEYKRTGWSAKTKDGSTKKVSNYMTSIKLTINSEKKKFDTFKQEDIKKCKNDFSEFYDDEDRQSDGQQPHFVLFALKERPGVPHKTIRVQVIDWKLGKPLAGVWVKKISFNDNAADDIYFKYTPTNANITGAGNVAVQRALDEYYQSNLTTKQYDCRGPAAQFGRSSTTAYNNFLEKRKLLYNSNGTGGPYAKLESNQNPPAEVSDYIVKEYNGMHKTDQDGYLHIKVPAHKYLDKTELKLKVTFWDYPVALEGTKASDDFIRDNALLFKNNDDPLGFKIVWTGDQANIGADNEKFGMELRKISSSSKKTEFRTFAKMNINTSSSDKLDADEFFFTEFEKCKDDLAYHYTNEQHKQQSPQGTEVQDPHFFVFAAKDYTPEVATIRLQVLDVRSGRPVVNARVKKINMFRFIDADNKEQENTFYFRWDAQRIDVSNPANYSIQNAQNALNRFYKNEPVAAVATNRVYNCGNASGAFDNGDKRKAFNDYLTVRNFASGSGGPMQQLSEQNSIPPAAMIRLIIDEYNGMSQTDANGFLYIKIPASRYLQHEREFKINVRFWDFPVIVESLRSTPDALGRNAYYITSNVQVTGFNIEWRLPNAFQNAYNNRRNANQNNYPNPHANISRDNEDFCWWTSQGSVQSQFKTSALVEIKNQGEKIEEFEQRKLEDCRNNFSRFYNNETETTDGLLKPHFVLFAMHWCQPVWDGIHNPPNLNQINYQSYTFVDERPAYDFQRRYTFGTNNQIPRFMHVVTNDNEWVPLLYTKGYGTYNAPRSRGRGGIHNGLDIHCGIGDFNFALHGGNVDQSPYIRLNLTWQSLNHSVNPPQLSTFIFSYLHLNRDLIRNGTNTERRVMAGEIIGWGGRMPTINDFPDDVPGHTHVYFSINNEVNVVLSRLRNAMRVDDPNRLCIPYEDLPLLFPCACQFITSVRQPETANPEECYFSKFTVISRCWAPPELRCPHMFCEDDQIRNNQRFLLRVQFQLLWLFRNNATNGTNYLNPGILNQNWGVMPEFVPMTQHNAQNINNTRANGASQIRRAIYRFREVNNLLFNPTNNPRFDSNNYNIFINDQIINQTTHEITPDTTRACEHLNNIARIERPRNPL